MKTQTAPITLIDVIRNFSDPDVCVQFVASLRWSDGPECPMCGGKDHSYLKTRRIWKCKGCKKQFSVKVGTIFEDSPIGLDKWLCAMWLMNDCKNGISSYEMARDLGITQKSAWFMLHRVRKAQQTGSLMKLGANGAAVEVDETFIGGKSRNMHREVRARKITGTGASGKVVVMGMLGRGGNVKATVINNRDRATLHGNIIDNIAACAEVFTDELPAYSGLEENYNHKVVNHAEEYTRGKVHTNGMENFWSLLKRGLNGTYVSVQPYHLFRYLDEQTFRYNNRKGNGSERFKLALSQVGGKRLTYNELTGKSGGTSH
jgi:transposase-like protein